MMRRFEFLRAFLAAAALALAPAWALALEEQSLLTPDGTLHVLRAGRAIDLGIEEAPPDSILIEHASRAQDGTTTLAILPGSESYQDKRGLQLGYDEETRTLLLLWTEDISAYSHIRIGVFRDGAWTNSPLLPSEGISRAYNPEMRITHQRVTYLDENDAVVAKTSSIVSVIWWEEAAFLQARLAALFLDEAAFDPENLAVYDIPALTGGVGASAYNDVPSGAYLFPTLQADGLSGAVLASYADLHAARHRVLRISYPDFQGKPSEEGNLDWKRRHIPIVGIAADGPLADMTPRLPPHVKQKDAVGTSIGSGYKPTLYWLEGASLKYTRLGATDWEPVRTVAIDDTMTYERALALVVGMGSRN
jgi:hypothetical protein